MPIAFQSPFHYSTVSLFHTESIDTRYSGTATTHTQEGIVSCSLLLLIFIVSSIYCIAIIIVIKKQCHIIRYYLFNLGPNLVLMLYT